MWLRLRGRSGDDALAGAAERGWWCPVVDSSPFISCHKPRLPSAEATGQLFIHGFPQEVFLELQPGPFQLPVLTSLCPVSNSRVDSCPPSSLAGSGVTSYTASAQVWCTDFRGCGELENLSVWCDALERKGRGLSLSREWSPTNPCTWGCS